MQMYPESRFSYLIPLVLSSTQTLSMVVVERLLRRNQDYLLIDTIKRVGVSNYSLLARLTGLNPETIRYKVNRHLVKMGLGVFVNVNFADLGLAISLLTLKVNPAKVTALF